MKRLILLGVVLALAGGGIYLWKEHMRAEARAREEMRVLAMLEEKAKLAIKSQVTILDRVEDWDSSEDCKGYTFYAEADDALGKAGVRNGLSLHMRDLEQAHPGDHHRVRVTHRGETLTYVVHDGDTDCATDEARSAGWED